MVGDVGSGWIRSAAGLTAHLRVEMRSKTHPQARRSAERPGNAGHWSIWIDELMVILKAGMNLHTRGNMASFEHNLL